MRRLQALELNWSHNLFFKPPNQSFEISQKWLYLEGEEESGMILMERSNIIVDIAQGITRHNISLSQLFRVTNSLGVKTHEEDIGVYLMDFSIATIYLL